MLVAAATGKNFIANNDDAECHDESLQERDCLGECSILPDRIIGVLG
jgi:hypothetical protein